MEFERFALRAGILHESQNYLGGGGGLAGSVACVASVSNRVIARKLEVEGGGGGGGGESLATPPPSPVIPFFFALVPAFLDELARKRLLRRLVGSFFPLPLPVIPFFFSRPNFSRRTSRGNACNAG